MITKEILIETGKKKGLKNKEHIEKTYFQDIFLFNLFKATNKFVFKGGTALYKFYGLSRFSEDLDFSLASELSIDEIEEIMRICIKNIDIFEIKSIKKIKGSILFKIKCKGILTEKNTLRIDVSLKNKILLGFDVKNYVSDYIDISPFSLRVLKPEEMISEKFHALIKRDKARDLYDLFFLLRSFKFNKALVEEKLKIFGMTYNISLIKEKINKIKPIWEKELRAFVLEELPDYEIVKEYVEKALDEVKSHPKL